MKKWYVNICKFENDEVVRSIECDSERQAEKVDNGVNINLNHEDYYTEIVEKDKEDI